MAEVVGQIQQDVNTLLYAETQPIGKAFAKIEKVSTRKREECFAGISALVVLYLIFGSCAQLLCDSIGFGYPAYMTLHAIESADKKERIQWLLYWTTFSFVSLFDFFIRKVESYVPIYWLTKCIFLLWLSLPMYRGAEKIYRSLLQPVVSRILPSSGEAQ
uniref:Receptor expression-enhancing protein n=1 Tax=Trichuris muris TaxID=70415 RepID=A0A5S6QWY4_TRIMR